MTQTPMTPTPTGAVPETPKADPAVVEALDGVTDAQAHAAEVVKAKQLEVFQAAADSVVRQETTTTTTFRLAEPVQWTDISGYVQSATAVTLTERTNEGGTVTRTVSPAYATPGPDGQYFVSPAPAPPGVSNALPEELFDVLTPSPNKKATATIQK